MLNTVLSGKKLSEKFAERQKKNDLIVLAPVIYESLLRNPALWQYDDDDNDDDNFTTAIQSIGVDWPDDLNVHIGATIQTDNNISFRHYVVCRRCPDINPFNAAGGFNTPAITAGGVSVYHLINGYHLQLEGVSRAQKDLARIADKFVDAYQNFRRLQREGVLTCTKAKANGECNYFRGCDFGQKDLLPCTETKDGRRLKASEFPILGGDFYSVWGDVFVYNGGAVGKDREQPMALVTTGPLSVQVQLIVPEPI